MWIRDTMHGRFREMGNGLLCARSRSWARKRKKQRRNTPRQRLLQNWWRRHLLQQREELLQVLIPLTPACLSAKGGRRGGCCKKCNRQGILDSLQRRKLLEKLRYRITMANIEKLHPSPEIEHACSESNNAFVNDVCQIIDAGLSHV